ncbi:hypothetical protein H6P81_012846 [Aristolochia fimbriata]|uniref:Uncharacterized protein n=1 Tax=Aristolochia fimbriata TaxID=158543 RepID=A0AAV7EHM6_ARIFI|nr:hypothetical protein H6P81_012846 [Aristolochia fimbriata]
MGIAPNHREISSLSELVALWKTSIARPCGRLDLPPSGERDPSRDPGTTSAYYTWWMTHMSSLFQLFLQDENSDEDYDNDRSHPAWRRLNGKRPVGASSASKKRAPLTILADASGSASKKKKKARKEIFSSPETPAVPREEASVVEEPAEITPTLTEGLPVQEGGVVETPATLIEAVVEAEAPPPAVEEEAPTPTVEVPAIEAVVEVIQEEVPTTEEALETILAPEEEVIEVVPAVDPVVEPAVEEVPIVQSLATPPTSSSLTSSQTPSQEFLSYVEGLMVQAWRDRIVPRMLSPAPASETLKEIERSAGEKALRTSRDEAESIARNTLAIVSSKLEEAKATLGEVIEELSEAKAEEEDARERLELAREQLQSAGTKVAYLITQAEQVQESVRGLKTGVVEAKRLIARVIATPTLGLGEGGNSPIVEGCLCGVTAGDGEESLGAALFSAF